MDESDPLSVDVDMYITVTILTDITSIQCRRRSAETNFHKFFIYRYTEVQSAPVLLATKLSLSLQE